jgi:hypothetical protein
MSNGKNPGNSTTAVANINITTTNPTAKPKVTQAILDQIKNDSNDIDFYNSNPADNPLYKVLQEIFDVNQNLLADSGTNDYNIATCVGVSVSGGNMSYNSTNRDLNKLTYLIAFRTPFVLINEKDNASLFDTEDINGNGKWWEKANSVRLKKWPTLQRLAKNGEEEVFLPQKDKVQVTTVADLTIYTDTINGSSITFTSGINATAEQITQGLATAIAASGQPVTVKQKDDYYFIIANVTGTAFTHTVDSNLTLSNINANPSVPTSAIVPPIINHLYHTKDKYDYFEITLHKQIEPTFFDYNDESQVRIPYYFKAQIEAPFYPINVSWVGFCRSFPYNVVSNNGIPYPISGFTKIVISNIKTLNSSNQLVPDTAVFYPEKKFSVANYRQFPVADSIVSGDPITILNGKLKIKAFKKKRKYVSVNITTNKGSYTNGQNITIKENGDIYSGSLIINQENSTDKYNPDIFLDLNYKDLKIYYESTSDKFYINELEAITLYADFTLAGTVVAANLIGLRIYKENSEYFIQVSSSNAVGNNVDSDSSTTTFIIGSSGLTIGIGIDVGNSFDNSTVAPNPARRTYFEDIILANNCPNWVAMTNADKIIIRSVYGVKQSAAQNIWLRNIVLFNKLDLQINNSSYYNVLKDCAGYAEGFYYNNAISKLEAKGLKTTLNVVEEYVVLTLMYNAEATFDNSARAVNFVNAINNHSHALLISAVNSVSSSNFSKGAVLAKLNTSNFKKYYNDFHFHNLAL